MFITIKKGKSRGGRRAFDASALPDPQWRSRMRMRVKAAVYQGRVPKANLCKCELCSKRQAKAYHHNKSFPLQYGYNMIPICNVCLLKVTLALHPLKNWDQKKQQWKSTKNKLKEK